MPELLTQGPMACYERPDGSRIYFDVTMKARRNTIIYTLNNETNALTDALTGALNKRSFDHDLKGAVADANRYVAPGLSLLLLDGDKFKDINDTFGHGVGDQVLKWATNRYHRLVRETDRFYRIGGDEFAVITAGHASDTFVQKLITHFNMNNCPYTDEPFSFTIGVADHTKGMSLDKLKERADQALYTAKDEGRNCFARYTAT